MAMGKNFGSTRGICPAQSLSKNWKNCAKVERFRFCGNAKCRCDFNGACLAQLTTPARHTRFIHHFRANVFSPFVLRLRCCAGRDPDAWSRAGKSAANSRKERAQSSDEAEYHVQFCSYRWSLHRDDL